MVHESPIPSMLLAGLCLVLVLLLVWSTTRQEDERRSLIFSRAGECTLYPTLVLLALDAVSSLLGKAWMIAPFVSLCLLSLFYAGALAYFSRKYGD